MKKLILITIVLMSAIWSAQAGTEYDTTDHHADSISVTNVAGEGLSRYNFKVAMLSNTRLLVLTLMRPTAQHYRVSKTTDWGTTWGTDLNASVFNGGSDPYRGGFLYAFGDTAYALSSKTTSTSPFTVRLYNASLDTLLMATVYAITTTGGDRNGLLHRGSNILIVHTSEGTIDTQQVLQTDGAITATTTYTKRESDNVDKLGNGQRIPFSWSGNVKGGIALLDVSNEDLFWADTTGLDTISTAIVPNAMPALGSQGENMMWIVPVKDSFGIIVWQTSTTPSACSLNVRPFHISQAGTGSGTIVFDASTIKLVDPGTIPGGFACNPVAMALWGTDTVIASAQYWPDTTSKRAWQIRRWWSTDKGATWGASQVVRDSSATADQKGLASLQSPPRIYRNGNDIRQAWFWQDSAEFNAAVPADQMRVYLDVTTTAAAAPSGSNVILRGGVYQGQVIR